MTSVGWYGICKSAKTMQLYTSGRRVNGGMEGLKPHDTLVAAYTVICGVIRVHDPDDTFTTAPLRL